MFNAIADKTKFDTFKRYATAKQAGTALTFELGRRVKSAPRGAGIAVHCVSPGMVNTNLGRFAGAAFVLAAPLRWGAHEDVHSRSGAGVVRGAIEVTGGC